MQHPHLAAVLTALVACSCSSPHVQANKVIELVLPAAAVSTLVCETHNGGITVQGETNTDTITLRAELSARGTSEADAQANLELLEIGREEADGRLRLWGKYPADKLVNRSPSFAFTLTVPRHIELQLESHHGPVKVAGVDGNVRLATHDGKIEGNLRSASCAAETHNGDVELQFGGEGNLDGSIRSHNGNVVARFADGRRTNLAAETQRGRIETGSRVREARAGLRELRGRIGAEDTDSKLTVTTHNGNVAIR